MTTTASPRRQSPREKLLLTLEILVVYGRVRWLMDRHTVEDAVAALRRGTRRTERTAHYEEGFESFRLAAVVGRVLRLLPTDSRCLMRSLVLVRLMARRGIATRLVIGVRTAPEFGAHAWVEQGGLPLLDPGDTAAGRLVEL